MINDNSEKQPGLLLHRPMGCVVPSMGLFEYSKKYCSTISQGEMATWFKAVT